AQPFAEVDVGDDLLGQDRGRHHAHRPDDGRSDDRQLIGDLDEMARSGVQAHREATPAERFLELLRKSSRTRRWKSSMRLCAVCATSPVVWTNRSSYSSGGAGWTIQYARNPSPVNLSNQPPELRIPRRTDVTN